MFRKLLILCFIVSSLSIVGCAKVPMAPVEQDVALKEFNPPSNDNSSIYVYRNCFVGAALKKTVYLDNKAIGESAENVYFHTLTSPGSHVLSTESEFSENDLPIETEGGKNYFVEQYIKMGVFVGGANLRLVDEETGKKNVLECGLAEGF